MAWKIFSQKTHLFSENDKVSELFGRMVDFMVHDFMLNLPCKDMYELEIFSNLQWNGYLDSPSFSWNNSGSNGHVEFPSGHGLDPNVITLEEASLIETFWLRKKINL